MLAERLAATLSSQRQDWNTPESILRLLHAGWPEGVSLDPCSNAASIVEAAVALDEQQDGLKADWSDGLPAQGLIYVNPPYGRALPDWCAAISIKHQALKDAGQMHAIASLVPARTDTAWMRRLLIGAEGIIFLSGRVRFLGAAAGAPFPSAIVLHQHGTLSRCRKVAKAAQQQGALIFNA